MQFASKCPVAFTSRILGGKWKARIIWALVRTEPLRFSEVRREYPAIPPKTEYRLTELGNTLRPVMSSMALWGGEHRHMIEELEIEGAE